jgi:multimeric flavodoxin WrbA
LTDQSTIAKTEQKKHVVAINGSPRTATTHKLLEQISARLALQQIEVTVINLAGQEIGDCTGCEVCIRKTSQCYQRDAASQILPQLVDADGVILASPVYLMHVSGKLKSLIDKTASWVHRPPMVGKPVLMVGKPVLMVATTGGSGLRQTLDYLKQTAIQWGAHPTGKIGRRVTDLRPVSDVELASFSWHLNNEPQNYRPSLAQLIFYQVQKVIATKVSSVDRAYWAERGWDKSTYFYPCRISLAMRWIANAFYHILYHRVTPVDGF